MLTRLGAMDYFSSLLTVTIVRNQTNNRTIWKDSTWWILEEWHTQYYPSSEAGSWKQSQTVSFQSKGMFF